MIVAGAPGLGRPRVVRAATLAAVGVAIGAAAHSTGGGCVELLGVAGALVVLGPASWLLVRREVSGAVLVGWLGLGQVFMHLVLHAACPDEAAESRRGALLLAAHVAAVIAAAAALRLGEAGLWAARRLRVSAGRLRRLLALLGWTAPLPREAAGVAAATVLDVPPESRAVVLGWRVRRGPPMGLAFA